MNHRIQHCKYNGWVMRKTRMFILLPVLNFEKWSIHRMKNLFNIYSNAYIFIMSFSYHLRHVLASLSRLKIRLSFCKYSLILCIEILFSIFVQIYLWEIFIKKPSQVTDGSIPTIFLEKNNENVNLPIDKYIFSVLCLIIFYQI